MGQAHRLARFAQFCAEWESNRDILSRSPTAASRGRWPDFRADLPRIQRRLRAPGFSRKNLRLVGWTKGFASARPASQKWRRRLGARESKRNWPVSARARLDDQWLGGLTRTRAATPGAIRHRSSNYPAACCIWSTICRSRSGFNSTSRETGLSLSRRKISPCRAGAIVP
jgi:hypothetical protein